MFVFVIWVLKNKKSYLRVNLLTYDIDLVAVYDAAGQDAGSVHWWEFEPRVFGHVVSTEDK